MKLKILKYVSLFIVLPALLIGFVLYIEDQGFFDIQSTEVTLEQIVNNDYYYAPLILQVEKKLSAQKGRSLLRVDFREISDSLKNHKWIREIQLARLWPSQLRVRIVPKEMKAAVLASGGRLLPVTETGEILPHVPSSNAPDVVLLKGDIFERDSRIRERAIEILAEIPDQGEFSRQTISEVRFDQREGFWMSLIEGSLGVRMGFEQVAIKSARVSQVIQYLNHNKIQARVIDANFSKKVLVKLRKAP